MPSGRRQRQRRSGWRGWGGLPLPSIAGADSFSPLSLAPEVYAVPNPSYLYQDDAHTTPVTAGGQACGAWLNLGTLGGYAIQGTAGARPTYQTSGGKHWLETDGSDDFLRLTFDVSMDQPWTRIAALRRLSDTGDKHIFGGAGSNVGVLYYPVDTYNLFDGSAALPAIAAPPIDTDYIVTEVHNGGSSTIQIDDGAPETGNPGANASGGITIGASNSDGSFAAHRYYAIFQSTGVLGDADQDLVRAALSALCASPPL